MRASLLLLTVVLTGCYPRSAPVSQHQILKRAQAEIAQREPWSATAAIIIQDHDDFWGLDTWQVRAGAFDYSDAPRYHGIELIPGTERELWFNRAGCLTHYFDCGNRCPRPPATTL